MLLSPRAGAAAGARRARGLKLNHPEAVATASACALGARDGRTLAELMTGGQSVPTRDEVMEGVPAR